MKQLGNPTLKKSALKADDELVRVNISVPKSTRDAWKIEAIKRSTSMQDLAAHAVDEFLKRN